MPEFAQFVALRDDPFRLPNDTSNNRKLTFDLPMLDTARTVVLMFKVAMSGADTRLQMRVNDNHGLSIDFDLDPSPGLGQPRSWHEIMGPPGGFKEFNNVLSVTADGESQDKAVVVSDVVFL